MPRGRKKQEDVNEEKTQKKGRRTKTKRIENDTGDIELLCNDINISDNLKVLDEVVNEDVNEVVNEVVNKVVNEIASEYEEDSDDLANNTNDIKVIDNNEDDNGSDDVSDDWNSTTNDIKVCTENSSANTKLPRSVNTRVNIVDTNIKGRTYNRSEFSRKYINHTNHHNHHYHHNHHNKHKQNKRGTPTRQSVLRFNYADAIATGKNTTLSEASLDDIIKYIIASNTNKPALCNVFRNILSGIHHETSLPQTTYVANKANRVPYNRRN
jgi:ABC-type nickel/cobalt efflux system permease component RcnA